MNIIKNSSCLSSMLLCIPLTVFSIQVNSQAIADIESVEKQLQRAINEELQDQDKAFSMMPTQASNTAHPDNQIPPLPKSMQSQLLKQMIKVEGGSFSMGSDETTAREREKPAHTVKLDGFYIAQTEVTQALFEQVMGWNNSYFPCADCAVNNISWFNMKLFIQRLNQASGKTFRLPSEAEWEYAARGGQKTQGYRYSGSNNIGEVSWFAGNGDRRSHPVAQKKPNELGLYDMTGNLWEFCEDTMRTSIYKDKNRVNPLYLPNKDPKHKTMKVLRGSGYEFAANESEVYRRDAATNNVRMPDIGFRLAMSLAE